MTNKKRLFSQGFSIVEAMVALGIMGAGALGDDENESKPGE